VAPANSKAKQSDGGGSTSRQNDEPAAGQPLPSTLTKLSPQPDQPPSLHTVYDADSLTNSSASPPPETLTPSNSLLDLNPNPATSFPIAPSTAEIARKSAALAYLSQSAIAYLILVAQKPFQRPTTSCRESGSHPSTLYKWRASLYFRQIEATIRADPDMAANFALRYAQPGAVGALMANLPRGGRTATDAASALLREGRERGDAIRKSRLAETLERMMEEERRTQVGSPPTL